MATYGIIGILICLIINEGNGVDWTPLKVINFFKAKNVFFLDAALCSNKDNLLMMKSANAFFPGVFRPISEFHFENRKHRLGIFVDVGCLGTQKLLSEIKENWFTLQYTWLIWDSEDLIIRSFLTLPISTFSEVFKLTSDRLIRLHKTSYSLPMTQREEGFWNSETAELQLTTPNIIIDFQRSPLRVGIVFIEDVFNKSLLFEQLENKYYKSEMDVSNRFTYAYVRDLVHKYNFTVEAKFADVWGVKTADGQWKGLMKLLVTNEIDLTMSPMALIMERLGVAFPTVSTMMHWMVVVFKQPRATTTYRAMLVELSPLAWAAFILLVFLGAVMLAFTEKYCQTSNSDGSFVLGFLQTVGIMANQGLSQKPQSNSSRAVCLTMMIGCLLVSTYYSAGIMRALLTKSPPLIKTLDQMLASNIPLAAMNAPYMRHTQTRFLAFKAPLAKKLGENVLLYAQSESGIRCVLNGSAFVGDYYLVFPRIKKLFKSNSICDLTVFGAGPKNVLVNYAANVHFQELFQREFLLSMESGVMKKERDYWLNSELHCTPLVEFIHVPLASVSVALIIFVIGLLLSAATLAFEIYFGRSYIKKRKGINKSKIKMSLFQ